jgi:hypothetical protein
VIDKGRLVAQGAIDELRGEAASRTSLEELFIELVGGDQPQPALDWI